MSQTFDRSQLDGKDREQLSEIASALGVKSVSRMRKADLVEAIVTAATGSNGGPTAAPAPRKVRSTRGGGDDFASIAEEENALASGDQRDSMDLIRPRRRPTPANGADAPDAEAAAETNGTTTATAPAPAAPVRSDATGEREGSFESGDSDTDTDRGTDRSQGQAQWRDDDAGGKKRRRRRQIRRAARRD